jgi:hypothetical protein
MHGVDHQPTLLRVLRDKKKTPNPSGTLTAPNSR